MKPGRFVCLPFLLVALTPGLCFGQVSLSVQMPDGSPVPRQAWPSVNPLMVGVPFWVWNAYEGLRPRDLPGGKELGQPLTFGQQLVVMAVVFGGALYKSPPSNVDRRELVRRGWVLVGRWPAKAEGLDSEAIGWVEGRYLAQDEAIRDAASGVHLKGWLKRDIRGLKAGQQQVGATGTRSDQEQAGSTEARSDYVKGVTTGLKAPHHEAPSHRQVRFNEFFFIFGQTGNAPDKDFVLLGTEYQFQAGQEDRLLGWFPRWAVEIWYTREALQWNQSENRPLRPGRIYLTPDDALKAHPSQVGPGQPESQVAPKAPSPLRDGDGGTGVKPEVRPLLEERFVDNKPVPLRPDSPRFPILLWPEEERYRYKFPSGWRLVKVGAEGGFVDEEGNPVASAERIKELREELRNVEESIKRLEILLVVDDTESMRPWFQVAAQALEKVVSALTQQSPSAADRQVALAITFYSDFDPDDPGFPPVRTQSLSANPVEIASRLDQLRRHSVSRGGDAREMVFEGIIRGIRAAGFLPLSTKVVIVVGDDADKSDENDPSHLAERQVVEALASFPVPPHFFAIQAFPESGFEDRPVAAAFRKQMDTIARLYREHIQAKFKNKDKDNVKDYQARVLSTDQASRIVQDVVNYFETVAHQQNVWRRELQALRLGDFATRIGPAVQSVLEDLGIEQELAPLRGKQGFQVYLEGYTWLPVGGGDNIGETELVVLLSRREVEDVVAIVREFFDELGGDYNPNKFREILDKALGEKSKDFWEQLLKMTALLGASQRLRKFLKRDPDLSVEDLYELQGRLVRLEDILRGVRYEYRRRGGQGVWMRVGDGEPDDRWFRSFTGEVSWAWIRVRDEWP
ncbi:MAG: VWA domain-containing protein [Thermoguttaceae bacterium]|nr:VWA domain-containing protein [Thermoguttaceae bacterium]MDW8079213.1 VWA domain-containing protein [Thermoguttaceae bacterium]